jgi:outer membrane lipoprotein-sorting protein
MKKILFTLLISSCFFIVTAFTHFAAIQKLYVKVHSRQTTASKLVEIKSEICYEANGNMVTHFTEPANYILIANKQGEIKMYDPGKNTVMTAQSNMFSSQISQISYFLSNSTGDMGLPKLGFVPAKTYNEKDLIISEWQLALPNPKFSVQQIKLVHQNHNPIYMDYKGIDGKILRKVFYYGYQKIQTVSFPGITTEIVYEAGKDSAVTKTVYSDFKINEEAVSNYFNYKIPSNAKKAE